MDDNDNNHAQEAVQSPPHQTEDIPKEPPLVETNDNHNDTQVDGLTSPTHNRSRGRSHSRSPSYDRSRKRGRSRSRSRSREAYRPRSPRRRREHGSFDGGRDYRRGGFHHRRDDRGRGYRGHYNRHNDDRGGGNSNRRFDSSRRHTESNRIEPLDSYKIFMMRQDEFASPEVYQKRYEEYKMKYTQRVMRAFFEDHKKEEWLQQRYSPAIRRRAEAEERALMVSRAKALAERVKSGACNICFDEECLTKSADGIEYDNDIEDSNRILYIRRVPCSCPESALREAIEVGGEFQAIYLSDPAKKPQYEFDRSGWIVYATTEAAQAAMPKIQNAVVHDNDMPAPVRLQISQHRLRGPLKTPAVMSFPERIAVDLDQAMTLANLFDQAHLRELSREVGLEEIMDIPEIREKLDTPKKKLDFTIAYLRRVHHFIYYAAQQCRGMGDILHTHPAIFCRPAITERDVEEDQTRLANMMDDPSAKSGRWGTWAASLDAKLQALIEEYDPERQADLRIKDDELVAAIEQQEEKDLESIYETYVIPVGGSSDKHRCHLCTKLFKASEFVKKHLRNKHPEVVTDTIIKTGEDSMWQQYREDEKRPMPQIETNNTHAVLGNSQRTPGGMNPRSRQSPFGRGGGGPFGRGGGRQGRSRGPRTPFRQTSRPDPRDLPVDPRNVSTSYQDLDNMQDTKVELNFNALGSLPPPKKKAKTEEE